MALPLRLRNRLAELILASLHDRPARTELEALAAAGADPHALDTAAPLASLGVETPGRDSPDLSPTPGVATHRSEILDRARRGAEAVRGRPYLPDRTSLEQALVAAGWLFDAGLYFEVHEQLEPHWREATGETRDSLQGLIQATVGFEHLANGNVAGAVSLLHDGCARMLGRRLAGCDLDPFARAVHRCLDRTIAEGPAARLDRDQIPRFPSPTVTGGGGAG